MANVIRIDAVRTKVIAPSREVDDPNSIKHSPRKLFFAKKGEGKLAISLLPFANNDQMSK
jgi:hypothetical protein